MLSTPLTLRNYLITHDDWIRGYQRDVPVLALLEHEDEKVRSF
jgi:hypothetical protein